MHTASALGKIDTKSDWRGWEEERSKETGNEDMSSGLLLVNCRQAVAVDVMLLEGVLTASSHLGKDYFHDSRNGMTSGSTPPTLPTRPAQKALKVSSLAWSEWAVSVSWLYR
jgi:hypothetical protein